MKYMGTLTFPGLGIHDFDRAQALCGEFLRLYGKSLFVRWLAVPELHPDGHGWHWHVLTDRRIPVNRVRSQWTSYLARRGLEVSGGARWVRFNVTMFKSSQGAARYAAKYVSKVCDVPAGRHRYAMSDSARPLDPIVGMVSAEDGFDVLRQVFDVETMPMGAWCFLSDQGYEKDWIGPPLVLVRW
jgi:hypothetical protein